MVESPNTRRLSLIEAATTVAERSQSEHEHAEQTLVNWLKTGRLKARGFIPLNAHPNLEKAWEHKAPPRLEDLRPGAWLSPVDWERARVGRYRDITISETELVALLPKFRRGAGRRPSLSEVKAGVSDYVTEAQENSKNPTAKGLWEWSQLRLPGATRDQVEGCFKAIPGMQKPRGRPRKEKPSN